MKKLKKIKKIFKDVFKSLGESFLKNNDHEEISKHLMVLIKVLISEQTEKLKKIVMDFLKVYAIFSQI